MEADMNLKDKIRSSGYQNLWGDWLPCMSHEPFGDLKKKLTIGELSNR